MQLEQPSCHEEQRYAAMNHQVLLHTIACWSEPLFTHLPAAACVACFFVRAGGLTENDFIIADRINSTDLTELLAKRKARFWA
jgi:hypothetical protein